MDFKKLLEALKEKISDKKIFNLIILFLVGVLLIISSNFFKDMNKQPIVNTDTKNVVEQTSDSIQNFKSVEEWVTNKENKLKRMLEQMEGVGRVEVMINCESGEEQIPAVNINDSISDTEETDTEGGERTITQKTNGSTVVITNEADGSTKPLIVKKKNPQITGVYVVAEGAEKKLIELRIKKAVVTLFNLPENKVNVYPMKK